MKKEAKNYSQAYALFYCRASKKEIEAELPSIRKDAKTPSELELTLTEGVDIPIEEGDAELKEIVREAKELGMNYTLTARLENATNEQVATELSEVMVKAYQSKLYAKKEPFKGGVFYKDLATGVYMFSK